MCDSMEYDLYHDESQEAGYWHGILLIPTERKKQLLDILQKVRTNLRYFEVINFKGLKKAGGKHFQSVKSWLEIGVCSLMQRFKGDVICYSTGKVIFDKRGKRSFEYETLKKIIGVKFILFRIKGGHSILDNTYFSDYGAKVETTLRMGVKGGLHLLGSVDDTIKILSFHFDGHEHIGRHYDINRIVDRISDLRSYILFDKKLIVDDRSSDHRKTESQDYDDCQLIQLTDILTGAFRTILGEAKNNIQKKVSYPVLQLIDRWNAGRRRMQNSRWHGGFCISQCYLENSQWVFENIDLKKDLSNQLSFEDFK